MTDTNATRRDFPHPGNSVNGDGEENGGEDQNAEMEGEEETAEESTMPELPMWLPDRNRDSKTTLQLTPDGRNCMTMHTRHKLKHNFLANVQGRE